ncbi:two-component system, OmpR family, bacitracin resistance response regulator BceR [Amphibacillus marinus]|uniref:Two-component system, OmpR family, bacitracin resistance response regulator BceR n=1 Tax=Amphibacillus marinus TaxID=872970 RepID=A0A1H8KHP3_9BACI|nr:response regulator transcription factor [Amphibacillus marinus]SEN92479.1 two-component system, OmpR family, bacitracin resistance response regulator BceR [Amphibacillus marinus]
MKMNIYIVEDDQHLYAELEESLSNWSFTVSCPANFEAVMEDFINNEPHLVILDIQLPKYDGFHWCREIRAVSKVPVVFLSSRDHPMDMIMAMNMGADDYIQKPFNMGVLVAKIQAILRRTYAYEEGGSELIEWNKALIDLKRCVIRKDEQEIELTKNEFLMLAQLVKANNNVVSRHEIMRMLWEDDQYINDNTLTANITRLRQKLEQIGLATAIVTKKGLGYMAISL